MNIEAQAVVKLSSTCTFSTGEGNITVNERDVREYLPFESLILDLNQPFDVTETKGNYDVLVNVHGGGFTGQAQAIRHGIARALLEADPEYRGSLKRAGLLTRDPRMKERKNQVLKSTSFSTILKTLIWNYCKLVCLQVLYANCVSNLCSTEMFKALFNFEKCFLYAIKARDS